MNRQIGKGVNSSVFHRLITIHVTFIPEVVYIHMRNQKVESTLRAASLLLPAQLLQIGMVRNE